MRRADEHFRNEIFFPLFHALNAPAASFLSFIGIQSHAFDIAVIGIGNNAVFHLDERFNIHFTADSSNFGSSVVAEFFADFFQFRRNDLIDFLFISECFFIVRDFFAESK